MASPAIIIGVIIGFFIVSWGGSRVAKDHTSTSGWFLIILAIVIVFLLAYSSKGGDCTVGQYCSPIPTPTMSIP